MNASLQIQNIIINLISRLNSIGQWLPPFFLRAILFWEFWESGIEKYKGDNWFNHIQKNFPFPFDKIPADISWFMATWGEIVFSILLLLGLFTRFAALSLIVITAVATAAVHWPTEFNSLSELWQGYAISDNGHGDFKLPLLFVIMLMPLLFNGAGKFSIDHLIAILTGNHVGNIRSDFISKGLAFSVLGLTLYFVMPMLGLILFVIGLVLMLLDRFITPRA